jgi:hypothetical protein
MGPADRHCHEGQARIATLKARDRHDQITVMEKLDGSNVSVAKVNDEIIALGRAGYRAIASPYYQHVLFDVWVRERYERFDALLDEGERVVGEWLAQAHGTRYRIDHPDNAFVAFDLMRGVVRQTWAVVQERVQAAGLHAAPTLHVGGPLAVSDALQLLRERFPGTDAGHGYWKAQEPVEGAVWRVERRGAVDFLAKYVRPDKVDGRYLPEISGDDAVWNWRP